MLSTSLGSASRRPRSRTRGLASRPRSRLPRAGNPFVTLCTGRSRRGARSTTCAAAGSFGRRALLACVPATPTGRWRQPRSSAATLRNAVSMRARCAHRTPPPLTARDASGAPRTRQPARRAPAVRAAAPARARARARACAPAGAPRPPLREPGPAHCRSAVHCSVASAVHAQSRASAEVLGAAQRARWRLHASTSAEPGAAGRTARTPHLSRSRRRSRSREPARPPSASRPSRSLPRRRSSSCAVGSAALGRRSDPGSASACGTP